MADANPERDPEVLAVLHTAAVRAIDDQRGRLGDLRGRSVQLLGAAALVAGFLADGAFSGKCTTWFAWLGALAFVAAAGSAVIVLWPSPGWRLHTHPWNLLRDYERESLSEVLRQLTHHLGDDINVNEPKLQRLAVFTALSCIGLACEVVFFLLDLAIRR